MAAMMTIRFQMMKMRNHGGNPDVASRGPGWHFS